MASSLENGGPNEQLIISEPDDEDWEAIIIALSVASFALLLVAAFLLLKVCRRRHRVKCARKMETLLTDVARIQGMIFESGNYDSLSQPAVSASEHSMRTIQTRPTVQSRLQHHVKRANVDFFSSWTDGKTFIERPFQPVGHPIRVLICMQEEVGTETCKVAVVEALRKLCAHQHLDIKSICFCIVGDAPAAIPGVLRPVGETRVSNSGCENERHSVRRISLNSADSASRPSLANSRQLGSFFTKSNAGSSMEAAFCPIEIFPILCDAADYCLLLQEPPKEKTSDYLSQGLTTSWSKGTSSHPMVGTGIDENVKGASSFLVGLSVVALKADDEAFIVTRGWDYELEPHKEYTQELCNGWRFYEELQGIKLSGALLRLWALAVSHGSIEFVTRAKPWLEQTPKFSKMGVIAYFCCCTARAVRRKVQVSYISIILNIFLMHRKDLPIIPLGEGQAFKTDATPRQLNMLCNGARAFDTERIKHSLSRRRAICRAARLRCISKESHFNFSPISDTIVFRPPSQDPCAAHLAVTSHAFDESFEHADDKHKLFPHMSQHITLEALAARIRAFYILFLRRLNGHPGAGDAETTSAVQARHAVCRAYTKAAEASGHVVDHVRKYLCEIAEPQSYKHLLAAINVINSSSINNETNSRMSHHVEVDIIAAFNLRNAETGALLWEDKSDPYCTVELEGKRWTKLSTEVIRETLNPVWNFHGILEDYDFGDDLFFHVWDDDTVSFDDSLGTALLSGDHFRKGFFEGVLPLSEVKGHYGATLKVRARVVKSDKPAPTLPRPQSLQVVLQRAQMVHKKLQRTIRQVVREAIEECVENNIRGAQRIMHSGFKTSLWHFIQRSTTTDVQEKMDRASLATGLMERQSQSSIATVDELLKSMGTSKFDLASIPKEIPFARHKITCDSFIIMRYVLHVMQESHAIEIHSVRETWKEHMMVPEIWIRASLNDCKVEGHPHMVMIVIQHSKIVALVESTENWSWSSNMLQEVPPLCKVLKLQDPHIHPSRWCLSFGQLKELARHAQKELGDEVYPEATMTDIVKKYIWNRTEEAGMSYACLMNWQKLRDIDIFVSHAWKENFSRFVESVEQALSQRLQADETNLWICSLALFQSKNKALVKEQIGADLMDAPFDKALRRAKEVLVVRNAKIDNYNRAWCVYEIFRARQLALKITITGPDTFKGGAVDILSCVASDPNDEKQIKDAITNAGLEKELNTIVTEIKNKGSFSGANGINFASSGSRRVAAI